MSKEKKDKNPGQETDKDEPIKKNQEDFPLHEYRLVPIEGWNGYTDEEDEIDLVELAKHLWDNRTIIYKFVTVGIILGLMVALLSPKEYKSDAILMPEMPNSEGGASSLLERYGGLLGMSGGIDMGSDGFIPPQLYPQIIQSMPFQLKLLNTEVEFAEFDTTVTVYNFFKEVNTPSVLSYVGEYTIGLPGKIFGLFRREAEEKPLPHGFETDTVISVTKEQMNIINNMRERVAISIDEETGVINLSVEMPDPRAAAQIAQASIGMIREYVINYRTRKAEQYLEFVQEQKQNAKDEFELAQNRLAQFRDQNINLATARAETQLQRLESEYQLAFNVYNSLAQQVEQAKLKLQEQTPVVSVLQPVQVPVDDTTSGAQILIIFTLLAGILSIGFIFIRSFIKNNFQ